MELVGMCHICGRPAMEACALCGLLTCPRCLDPASGICKECMPEAPEDEMPDME